MNLILSDPVSKVPFIGRRYSHLLKKLGIINVQDLIHHIPHRYEDYSQTLLISELTLGNTVTVRGTIDHLNIIRTRRGKNFISAVLSDHTGSINVIWFNQYFLLNIIKPGTPLLVSGEVSEFAKKLAFISPEYEIPKKDKEGTHTGRIVPIYPETAGISSKWLRSRILNALDLLGNLDDPIPTELRKIYNLDELREALRSVHFPKSKSEIESAKRRLGFDELIALRLKGTVKKIILQKKKSHLWIRLKRGEEAVCQLEKNLPFKLTDSQNKAIKDIITDLSKSIPMNRLLQGEVGSGKTVVAAAAALAILSEGGKVAMMVPTEVLAYQHYKTFRELFKNLRIKISILTGSNKSIVEDSRIIIGTHALLFGGRYWKKADLIVIDEQHKFGVAQRSEIIARLGEERKVPHLLTMTATPIPRTLALTLLGDLDISTLKEKPSNRRKIKTWYVPEPKREAAYEWIKEQLRINKTQAIIVCPLIEESATESFKSVKSAKKEFGRIKKIFDRFRVGLIHGNLKSAEKSKVLKSFRDNKINVLVATPVIEVGIDIPNLTIIVIEGAERFGLSSLHQFRGRVGRSEKESYCLLFSGSETPQSVSRLKALEKIESGFELSEYDLKRRGPGEVFGLLQSGLTNLKIADYSDVKLCEDVTDFSRELSENILYKDLFKTIIDNISKDIGKIEFN